MGYQKYKKLRHIYTWDVGGTGDSAAVTGTIAIFSAPANCVIHKVAAEVLTAVTGATAETVGDGADVDGYLVDAFAATAGYYPTSVNQTACGVYQKVAGATDAADAAPEVMVYSAADTIDYVITGTATAGKIRFIVDFECY